MNITPMGNRLFVLPDEAQETSDGRDFRRKPIIGCGVVTDNGKYGQFFPMEL